MTAQDQDSSVRLGDAFHGVLHRWKLIAAFVLVFAFLAALYSSAAEEEYTSSATLTVSPITTNPFSSGAVNQQINITTEREILGSGEVARLAADRLEKDVKPEELLSLSDVAAPSGSQVLEVTVTTSSPEDAADFANALAEAYLDFRAEGAAEVALGYIAELDKRISALESAEREDAADPAGLASLREQRADLTLVADNPGRIIGEAIVPQETSSPGPATMMVIGAALGLLLGVFIAFLADRFDTRLRSARTVISRTEMDVIEYRSPDDDEALQWTRRALDDASLDHDSSGGPFVAAFFSVSGADLSPLVGSLHATIIRSGHAGSITVTADASGAGWPAGPSGPTWPTQGTVLYDASPIGSGATRASVADRSALVVIVCRPSDKVADFLRMVREIQPAKRSRAVCIFLSERTGRKSPRKAEHRVRSREELAHQ